MNAIAERKDSSPATVADMGGGLLAVIERAARDPNVDIDKMERLIEMQERVQRRNAEVAFYDALAVMQPQLPVITEKGGIKDRSGKIQSTYALWEDINEAISPILSDHGFSLTFKGRTEDGKFITVGILAHRDGHRETTEVELPADNSGSKNAVQAIGSAKSYGKRYAAFDLLNITTRGADDDGKAAGNAQAVNADQIAEMRQLMKVKNQNESKFVAYIASSARYAVEKLEDIHAADFGAAMNVLRSA